MADNRYQELIGHNPVNQGLDYDFVDMVMKDIAKKHFPEIAIIQKISHVSYKRRVGKRNSTFIYGYTLQCVTKSGKSFAKNLIYSSHSDGSRLRAFEMIQLVRAAGFATGHYRVITPLDFLPGLQAMIYEAVPGKTLLEYMAGNKNPKDLYPLITLVASWIRRFHAVALPPKAIALIPPFDIRYMNWPIHDVTNDVAAANTHQAEKLRAFITTMVALEKELAPQYRPGLVYGDLHPENVITKTMTDKTLTMIDFTDVAFGDRFRDCGTFIQQINFMGRDFYSESETLSLRTHFLEAYFKKPFAKLTSSERQRINLYQAWNSLRGFVYFFYQEEVREQSYGLLEDAWLYLTLSLEKKKDITIAS